MKQSISQPSMRSIVQAPSQTTTSPSISSSYSLTNTYVLELERLLQRGHSNQSVKELKYFDLYVNSRHVFGGCLKWFLFINNE